MNVEANFQRQSIVELINCIDSSNVALKSFEKECYSLQMELSKQNEELKERLKTNKKMLDSNVEIITMLKKMIEKEQEKNDNYVKILNEKRGGKANTSTAMSDVSTLNATSRNDFIMEIRAKYEELKREEAKYLIYKSIYE